MDRRRRIEEECVPAKQFSQQDALTSRVGSSFRSLPTRHPDPPLFLSLAMQGPSPMCHVSQTRARLHSTPWVLSRSRVEGWDL